MEKLWNHEEPFGVLDSVRILDMGEVISSCSDWGVLEPWSCLQSWAEKGEFSNSRKADWLRIDSGDS